MQRQGFCLPLLAGVRPAKICSFSFGINEKMYFKSFFLLQKRKNYKYKKTNTKYVKTCITFPKGAAMNPLSTCVRSVNHVLCALPPCLANARRQGMARARRHVWLVAGSVEPTPRQRAVCTLLPLPEPRTCCAPLRRPQALLPCVLPVCKGAAYAKLQR